MKKTNLIYLFLTLLTCTLAFISCKESHDSNPTGTQTVEYPLFSEGQIVNSDFYVNDVLREQMIDTVVNFGNSVLPALFYVNQQHTFDGAPISIGNHYSNIFRSLSRQDIYDFIILWGEVLGIEVNINDTSATAVARRQHAFYLLQTYLLSNDIDFPLLVALSHNLKELQCAKKWVDAAGSLSAEGVELADPNTPDHILRAMEISGHNISDLSMAVQSAGMTEKDFLLLAHNRGIDLENSFLQMDSPRQFIAIALVVAGVKMFASWTLRFISHGNPNPNLASEYASYLNDADSNVMNYYSRKDTVSPTYKVAYCTLATAEFYIETNYDAYHSTLPGQYINRVGMIVESVRCSWGMHVDGSTTFQAAQDTGTVANPIAYANATVAINYGDCCCYKRKGVLQFQVTANNGYDQISWKPSK